jgi:hypothetical protein
MKITPHSLPPLLVAFSVLLGATAAGATPAAAPAAAPETMFDDFSYATRAEMVANGWCLRTAPGWPGIPGATWRKEAISLLDDPDRPGNRLVRLTAYTDGTGANTQQAQICHKRKYLEGTYAARVRFTDLPVSGPAGDQVVQTFYAISPLVEPMHPDYSEADFEYLPNGGWGSVGPTLFATTWETFSPEPNWKKDNVFDTKSGSHAGWHTLVLQIAGGKVRYFIDGQPLAEHGGRFFPEVFMSINFNLWFTKEGVSPARERREYHEDIDWVYFEARTVVSPAEVEAKVAALRRADVKFRDTVKPPAPELSSPCDF